jgi:hypothetical protein
MSHIWVYVVKCTAHISCLPVLLLAHITTLRSLVTTKLRPLIIATLRSLTTLNSVYSGLVFLRIDDTTTYFRINNNVRSHLSFHIRVIASIGRLLHDYYLSQSLVWNTVCKCMYVIFSSSGSNVFISSLLLKIIFMVSLVYVGNLWWSQHRLSPIHMIILEPLINWCLSTHWLAHHLLFFISLFLLNKSQSSHKQQRHSPTRRQFRILKNNCVWTSLNASSGTGPSPVLTRGSVTSPAVSTVNV